MSLRYGENFTFTFTLETSIYVLIIQLIASFVEQSFFCHLQLAETDTTPTAVTTVPDPPTQEEGGCGNPQNGQHTCYNCTTAPICIKLPSGSYLHAGSINCADLDAKTPHCNNGKCSATATEICDTEPPKSQFICTSNGYFPDPNDCRKFYFCVRGTAKEFTCSSNFVYSHQKNACIKKTLISDCAVIKCKYATVLEYVVYPKDPNVFGLCIRDSPTLMFKCPEDEEFDTKTSQCIFVCKMAGLFPVPGNERKYRECVAVGIKFELNERECPEFSIFDAVKGRCVVTSRLAGLRRWK
jgi:hypothetical protein